MPAGRALVLASRLPFATDDSSSVCRAMAEALRRAGWDVDSITVPFLADTTRHAVEHATVWRLLNVTSALGQPVDLAIATSFPTYLIRHPGKIVWLLPGHRHAAELDTRSASLERLDREGAAECLRVFGANAQLCDRFQQHTGLRASPLAIPATGAHDAWDHAIRTLLSAVPTRAPSPARTTA